MFRFRVFLFGITITLINTAAFAAERFPMRAVRIVIPFTAGGTTDIVGRLVGQGLSQAWEKPVVIDNRLGAGGNIGTEIVAQAGADGHNLLLNTAAIVIVPSLSANPTYHPIRDFIAVSKLGYSPALLLVTPKLQLNSVADLVKLARSQPGKLNFGSSGVGSSVHLAAELFKSMAKVDIPNVSYKGTASAYADLMSGQVEVLIGALASSVPLAKSGRIKALAVTTAKRSTFVPDLPTISESGVPGYDFSFWYGIFASANTYRYVVSQLNQDITKVLNTPAIIERFAANGVTPESTSLAQFSAEVSRELETWSRLIKTVGIQQ